MTQSPQSGQDAPLRTEFGSVTAPQHPGSEAHRSTEWGSTTQNASQNGAPNGAGASTPPAGRANGGSGHGTSAPTGYDAAAPAGYDTRATSNIPTFTPPSQAGGPRQPIAASPAGAPPTAAAKSGSGRAGRSARARGPRRARLQLRHINPWTVLKFSCVLSIALFFVWLIVVGVLFGVLDAAGVVKTLNDAYIQVNPGAQAPIRAGIVFGGAAIIGAVNIILFIALSTVGAVVYNLCADLVGGIEITLSER